MGARGGQTRLIKPKHYRNGLNCKSGLVEPNRIRKNSSKLKLCNGLSETNFACNNSLIQMNWVEPCCCLLLNESFNKESMTLRWHRKSLRKRKDDINALKKKVS